MYMSKLTRQVERSFTKPAVQTSCGTLCGLKKEEGYIFRGIPYAQAKRFHLPEPVKPWEGIRDAIIYGPVCPEPLTKVSPVQFLSPNYYWPQDENCHYVNVWTPGLDQKKRPVMVWIHGGGWTTGSSIEQYAYDGENLSQFGDVVVVSLNHRLNLLGYLDLSEYGEEYKHSARAGLADLVMALEWVRDNIAVFGGDSGNVTIMGQSGGGSKVMTLLNTPAADGLYHKATVQSGGDRCSEAPGGYAMDAIRKEMARRIVEKAGGIEQAETMPYWELSAMTVEVQKEMETVYGRGSWNRWEAVPDGEYFLGYPHVVGFRQENLHIPMITCSVFGEQQCNLFADKNSMPDYVVSQKMRERFGDKADSVTAAFREAYPDKRPVDVLFMDTRTRPNIRNLSLRRAAQGGAVWNAMFTLESPMKGGITAWHCSDIPFMFHNAEYIEAAFIPGVSEDLQDRMAGAWVAFARTGDPNINQWPYWPQVDVDEVPTMIFDRQVRVAVDHDKELMSLVAETGGGR